MLEAFQFLAALSAALFAGAAIISMLPSTRRAWAWTLIAAVFIGSAVLFTLVAIMPINRQLLAVERDLGSVQTRNLLARWGRLHGARSAVSAVAAVLMLWGLL